MRSAFLILFCVAGLGCTMKNITYCDEETLCTDPARPFCDVEGEFAASQFVARTCIPDPTNADAGPISHEPLRFGATDLPFGDVLEDNHSASATVTLKNHGEEPTGILTLELIGDDRDQFLIMEDLCQGKTLQPEEQCTIELQFEPSSVGPKSAALKVHAGPGGTALVSLTGTGVTPGQLVLDAQRHDFGAIALDADDEAQKVFRVSNTGEVSTGALTVELDDDAINFSIVSHNCSRSLAAASSCEVRVAFTPQSVGAKHSALRVSAETGEDTTASLIGVGSVTVTVQKSGDGLGSVTSEPAGIDCGTTCSADMTNDPITLSATPESGSAFKAWSGA